MKKSVFFAAMLGVIAVSNVCADASFGIFGVTVKSSNPVFSKALIQHTVDAATAFGIQRNLTIEAIDGVELSTHMFDEKALTPVEREVWLQSTLPPIQPIYIMVTGVFGGGCLAIPTWSLPLAKKGDKPKPTGVTDMRCAKTEDGFVRLKKVYGIAATI